LINYFSDFRFKDPFRRYSRSNSKVVRNRAGFQTFFALPNFRGRVYPKSRTLLNTPCLAARRVEKFRDVTPTIPKVIGANTLNFKPNLTCSPVNFFRGTPVPVRGVR